MEIVKIELVGEFILSLLFGFLNTLYEDILYHRPVLV